MKESKSSESQIVAILKEAAGDEVAGFTERVASKGLAPRVIKAAEPNRSASIERFNRTYRNAVLDAYLFKSIEQAQHMTEEWRLDDNERRPHGAPWAGCRRGSSRPGSRPP
ncbi:integrase core domain-containing protein [Eleftheria terrae]|uniref:integrase core domain-containing protein n=1 Tax=Eleftheria terrae TaxID=1597781 RepID=UPI00263AD3B0|nr:integrase core domain-containing protein [Eleftheria terrae]WKB56187.1 transposase [Eleftheria terrae]